MNHLNNNMTKMILLVLVAAVLLVALNLNHKKLGKEVALLGTLAVVLVAVYLGNNMMALPEDEEVAEVLVNNVAAEDVVVNNMPANNMPMNNMPVNNMPMNNVPVNNVPVNAEANEVNAANFEDDVNVEQVVEGFANIQDQMEMETITLEITELKSVHTICLTHLHRMLTSQTTVTTTTTASQEMFLTPKIFYHHQ